MRRTNLRNNDNGTNERHKKTMSNGQLSPADAGALLERYRQVREAIDRAARQCGRDPASVELTVASKNQPAGALECLLQAGHRLFGENRVQEAMEKWPTLKQAYPDTKLHLIGPLQTNKVRDAVRLFDVIETVDRERLAEALAREQQKQGKVLRYFIEINAGEEPQKAGIRPADAGQFLLLCRDKYNLAVEGLMCIPPAGEQASPYFAMLRQLATQLGLAKLSMGMTADYQLAIQLGATHVRLGTAIFGARG